MFNHHIPNQYQSYGTEDPTVTLGNQYDHENVRVDAQNSKAQQFAPTIRAQQQPQNLRMLYEKEVQNCRAEIECLKEQIDEDQSKMAMLEETIIDLKKEQSTLTNENQKLFKDNQKQYELVSKLITDNRSMEMEIERFRNERKVYFNNLNNIQSLKRDISAQVAEKQSTIDDLSVNLRKIERQHSQCRLKIEDYDRMLSESDHEKEELKEQLKNTLQKYLSHGNILNKLQYQLREVNELNKSMKQKIYQLEEERKELYMKLGYDETNSKANLSDSVRSTFPTNQRSMIEIQSYMKEIGNILDIKKDNIGSRRKNYEQLKRSIECLEENL